MLKIYIGRTGKRGFVWRTFPEGASSALSGGEKKNFLGQNSLSKNSKINIINSVKKYPMYKN